MNRSSYSLQKLAVVILLCLITGNISAQQVVIGSTSGTTDYFYGPYYRSSAASVFNYSNYAYIYTAAELGIPTGSMITVAEWYKASGTITGNNTFRVWMQNSSATTLTNNSTLGSLTGTATQVYNSTTQSFTAGNNSYETFSLSTPFLYTGGSLIIVTGHVMSGTPVAANLFYINAATGKAIGYASDLASTSSSTLTTTYGDYRPTIRLTYVPGTTCSGAPTAGTASASTGNACPNVPFTLSLAGNTNAGGISLQWQSRPGTSGPWTNIAGATFASYSVPTQTVASQYRAYIVCSASTLSDTSNIVTVGQNTPASCYCIPVYTYTPYGCSDGDNINDFTLIGANSTSFNDIGTGCSVNAYDNRTAQPPVQLMTGQTYSGTMSSTYGSLENVRIWIDFDDNGYFDNIEEVGTNTSILSSSTPYSLSIPTTGNPGNHRMRVRLVYNQTASTIHPCDPYTYGETHDYTVTIITPCTTPSGLSATGITGTTANLSWGAVTGSAGYQYAVTTSSTPPASGTAQSGTTYNATGLTPGTTYYLHVRNSCGSTFSQWATFSFTTVCTVPTGVAATGVTVTNATINWNAITGVTGYQYALNTSATPPASGTAIGTNSYSTSSLTPSTTYYFHVRTQCNATTFSAWTTITFTTQSPSCFSPASVTVTGLSPTGATINWSAVSGATDYEYAVTNSSTPPASGTTTTATTAPSGVLTPGTVYYAHVRNICSPTLSSIWTTTMFTTPYPPCNAPSVTLSNITVGGLTISWSAVATAVGYEYAVDTSATPPTSGTTTTNTTETIAGLIDETAYVLHVRTNCGPGGFSPWVNLPFATAAYCTAPTAILSNITDTKADINWNAMSGAVSYEYVVSTSITPPTTGTVTTGLNYNAKDLVPFTQYYIHLRSTCTNDISNWSTSGFITLAPTGVGNVNGNQSGISVYPNPVKNVVTVKISGQQQSGQLSLTDIAGRVIATYQVTATDTQVDMSELQAGVYMLKYSNDNQVNTIKVIKE